MMLRQDYSRNPVSNPWGIITKLAKTEVLDRSPFSAGDAASPVVAERNILTSAGEKIFLRAHWVEREKISSHTCFGKTTSIPSLADTVHPALLVAPLPDQPRRHIPYCSA